MTVTGRRIAVIGGGISGLTAGHILSRTDEVTLFEAADRLGGHADTHLVAGVDGRQVPVDTGFIVYNERTYPLLTRLFGELGVATQASEMSMSVSCSGCGVRYAGKRGPAGLGAGLRRRRSALPADALRGPEVPPGRPAAAGVVAVPPGAGRPGLAGAARAGRPGGRPGIGRRPDAQRFPARGRLLQLLHRALRGAAGRGGVVVPAGHRARVPGRVPVRLPRQSRPAVGLRVARSGAR